MKLEAFEFDYGGQTFFADGGYIESPVVIDHRARLNGGDVVEHDVMGWRVLPEDIQIDEIMDAAGNKVILADAEEVIADKLNHEKS